MTAGASSRIRIYGQREAPHESTRRADCTRRLLRNAFLHRQGPGNVEGLLFRILGGKVIKPEKSVLSGWPIPGSFSIPAGGPQRSGLFYRTPNPRIADALARWAAVVEREASFVASTAVWELVVRNLKHWNGEPIPLSRSWVDSESAVLTGQNRAIARLALVLAKAPYEVDETLVDDVLREDQCEERFIHILAWASFSGARRFAQRIAEAVGRSLTESMYADGLSIGQPRREPDRNR